MRQLGYPQQGPTLIKTDNQSLVHLMESNQSYSQAKEIHQLYWLREQVKSRIVRLIYIRGTENPADFLTKPLRGQQFTSCRTGARLLEKTENEQTEAIGG